MAALLQSKSEICKQQKLEEIAFNWWNASMTAYYKYIGRKLVYSKGPKNIMIHCIFIL